MPLLSSAILSSNTKNPAFPQRSAQPGLTHCKLSPESLPDLPFPQGNERKEISPNPHPCLPSLVFFPALGAPCAALSFPAGAPGGATCARWRKIWLLECCKNLAAGMLQTHHFYPTRTRNLIWISWPWIAVAAGRNVQCREHAQSRSLKGICHFLFSVLTHPCPTSWAACRTLAEGEGIFWDGISHPQEAGAAGGTSPPSF